MTPGGWRSFLVDQALPLVGLAGFGYSLPLLDLLGRNPEFLIAHSLTGRPLALAALLIATIPPLFAVLTVGVAGAISDRGGRAVWCAWIVIFGAMAGGALLGPLGLSSDFVTLVGALLAGVAALLVTRRFSGVRVALAFLAVTPLFAVIALVGWSSAAKLVRPNPPHAEQGVTLERPAPVVILQFDELPLASLLRAGGAINNDRFPNFARLAATSTWYADALAVAPSTTASVPAALTGQMPDASLLPTADDHPDNLFTLLGNTHRLQVDEPVTALCPPSLCDRALDLDGLTRDAVGVAGQLWLPPSLREHLPNNVQALAGFEQVDALGGDTANQRQDRARADIDAIDGSDNRPLLWYTHVVMPHVPWSLSSTGAEYQTGGAFAVGPHSDGTWDDDPVLARLGLERHLLQVGAADRLLGRLVDRLQSEGLWDDAVVVVLADHGAAFDPAEPYREPTTATVNEIYRIPLFVKYPGQTVTQTRFDLTYNVDVLPTLIDVLGADIDWPMDGSSIVDRVPGRKQTAALYVADSGEPVHEHIGSPQVNAVAARNAALLPNGEEWRAVAAGGVLGGRVGTPVAELDLVDGGKDDGLRFSLEQRSDLADVDTEHTGRKPVLVWGTLHGPHPPTDLLLALNGTAAGTLTRLAGSGTYAGVLDETLIRQGENQVQVFAPTAGAGTPLVAVHVT